MFIEPQSTIPLVYQLTDPFDSATYYVRSVIKDSRTGVTLDSANLTSQGSGRYTGTIIAPQDSTGLGRHIDVVTSVYTDAGYSTHSENYSLKVDNYIVRRSATSFGGSSSVDVDYDKIAKIFRLAMAEALGGLKIPKTNLDTVYKRLDAIAETVNGIKMPESTPKPDPVDFTPVLTEIKKIVPTVSKQIESIGKMEPVNLGPAIDEIRSTKDSISSSITELKNTVTEIEPKISGELNKISGQISKRNENLKRALVDVIDNGPFVDEPKKEPKREVRPELAKFFPRS